MNAGPPKCNQQLHTSNGVLRPIYYIPVSWRRLKGARAQTRANTFHMRPSDQGAYRNKKDGTAVPPKYWCWCTYEYRFVGVNELLSHTQKR